MTGVQTCALRSNDTRQTRVPYKLGKDEQGKLIYTDQKDAKIDYTARVNDPERYSSDFILALSFRLAAYIAPRLTGGDPFKLGDRAMKMYLFEISRAESSDLNEQQDEEEPESEFTRERE